MTHRGLVSIRGFDQRLRFSAAALVWIGCLLAVCFLLPLVGGTAITFLVLPAIVAGSLLGRWSGLIVGLTTPAAAWLTLTLAAVDTGAMFLGPGIGFGPVILAGIGFLSGQAVDELIQRRHAELVARSASDVLRIVASDRPLDETLRALTERIENLQPDGHCSVLLLDPETRTLHHGAAPSLPESYTRAIDGIEIGPQVGSCGTAAATGKTVVVSDLRHDPLWRDFRELAESHGLRACWSVPIRAADGRILGTYAIYYRKPRRPRAFELEAVEEAASLAALALEREDARERQRDLENQIRTSERLDGLEVLAGGVAHDLNNMLTGVLGSADLLAMELGDDARSRAHVDRIRSAARQASALADHLLLYAGRHSATLEDVDLSRLVSEVVDALQPSIPPEVRVVQRVAGDLPRVNGDAAQLRQVCTNLVLNAVDAMSDSRGKIEISTRYRDLTPDDLRHAHLGDAVEPGPFVELGVADEGCGMDTATQRHIFAPFFSTKRPGRGVGLASTLGIVRLHGGAVRVDSEAGLGSRFTVFLPVSTCAARPAVEEERPREAISFSGEALVVEDEEAVAEVVRAFLDRLGFESVAVGLGEAAVEMVREQPTRFRVVIIDLTLPDIPGSLVKSRMQELGANARFVLTSGYDWETANLDPAEDAVFLHKPYDLAAMRRTLELALAGELLASTSRAR